MFTKIIIKNLLSTLLHKIGASDWKIKKKRSQKEFVILTYHRVIDKDAVDMAVQPGMYVLQKTFKMQLEYLNKYFSIKPLHLLKNPSTLEAFLNKPICFLTFDDGWKDFYEYAFPLLKSYQAYATVFLPTAFIGTSQWFWPDQLLCLMKQVEIKIQKAPEPIEGYNPYLKALEDYEISFVDRTEKAIRILKTLREDEIEELLSVYSRRWDVSFNPKENAFLNWDEVRQMKDSGFIEFGSHTDGHKILKTLKKDEITLELEESKKSLIDEKVCEKDFCPFCYPSGVYDRHIKKMVAEAGYNVAVSTQKGWNTKKSDLLALKRIGIHDDMTSTEAMFACKIAGLL